MDPTKARPGSSGPAGQPFTTEAIEVAVRTVRLAGPGPLIVTLTGDPGHLEAFPELQDAQTWREYGAEVVLTATAMGLRGHAGVLEGVAGYALILPEYGTAWAVDRTGARHTIAMPGAHTQRAPGLNVTAPVLRGLTAMAAAIPGPCPPPTATRPASVLMIGGAEALRAEIRELAPPGELAFAEPGTSASQQWATARVVLVWHDATAGFAGKPEPGQRPPLLILLAGEDSGSDPWRDAARIGAAYVVFWPICRDWLAGRLQHWPHED